LNLKKTLFCKYCVSQACTESGQLSRICFYLVYICWVSVWYLCSICVKNTQCIYLDVYDQSEVFLLKMPIKLVFLNATIKLLVAEHNFSPTNSKIYNGINNTCVFVWCVCLTRVCVGCVSVYFWFVCVNYKNITLVQ